MTNRIPLRIAEETYRRRRPLLLATLLVLFPSVGFAGNFVAFGPQSYTRGAGSPVTVSNNFTVLNPDTSYTLRINNGGLTDGEFEKVSSSVISLNGLQIVGPSEFNQNVAVIEKPLSLAANNELAVELRGKPGGGVTIQIIGVDDDPPGVTITSPANGATVDTSPVTVAGAVNDAISGVADVTCNGAPAVVSGSSFTCDVSIADGPNTIVIQATDRAGNAASSAIMVNLIQGSAVRITSPADGDVIGSSRVLVVGELTAFPGTEVGVTVNGFVGLVNNGIFSALVPIDSTIASLTATARDQNGASLGSDAISISVQPPATEPVPQFQANPPLGLAPLTTRFDLVGQRAITQVALDLEGDGSVDFQGTTLEGQTFTYNTAGLYFPTVTITDDLGATQTAATMVMVYDFTAFDALIQGKWQGMKEALRQGNVNQALNFFTQRNQAQYRQVFENLTVPLSSIDQVLTDIRFVQLRGRAVEYEMLRTDERGELSYLVRFVIDQNGIWRIKDM